LPQGALRVFLGDPALFGGDSCQATAVTQVQRDDAFVVKAKFEGLRRAARASASACASTRHVRT
jgi:hypothetical protein